MRLGPHQIDTMGAHAGDALVFNPATGEYGPGPVSGGGSLTVQDENVNVATGVTQIDFQGAGVTATAGTGEVVVTIPGGGAGSSWGRPFPIDIPPTIPNAKDDEFDGSSSVTWSNTPTAASATAINATDSPDHLLITSAGVQFQGLVQAVPGAYPFTITACLADTDLQGTSDRGGGLILGPTGPIGTSNLVYIGDANLVRFAGMYNFNGTFVSVAGVQPQRSGRTYMKIRVNSATSIDSWINHMGSGWVRRHNAFNPGFTPGVMGLAASRGTGSQGSSSFFAWFRVS